MLHDSNSFEISFSLEIVTPCAEEDLMVINVPEGIPEMVDYYLADVDQYQLPEFSTNFIICELTYSF